MIISGLQKSSLLDYPSKIAAVVFTQGCNFRCPYCHNPDLLPINPKHNEDNLEKVMTFLKTRQNKLDAVVLSGGEPTLQTDIDDFFVRVKELGFLTKLDTNGTNPECVQKLVEKNLLDYIAMDIKAPLEKYTEITGRIINIDNIRHSIEIIKSSNINYEFRTTVVKSQLSFSDFEKIGTLLNGCSKYYLQKFIPDITYDKTFKNEMTYSNDELVRIKELLKKYIKEVYIRN